MKEDRQVSKAARERWTGKAAGERTLTTSMHGRLDWALYIHSLQSSQRGPPSTILFPFLDKEDEAQRSDVTDYVRRANMDQWEKEGRESRAQEVFVFIAKLTDCPPESGSSGLCLKPTRGRPRNLNFRLTSQVSALHNNI